MRFHHRYVACNDCGGRLVGYRRGPAEYGDGDCTCEDKAEKIAKIEDDMDAAVDNAIDEQRERAWERRSQ